ncbi:RWP-RK domain-containing protein [Cephalotus follicularis]|uniref:RWP-RK domain-containing protein n=1 Tax=Cephalotus follicularis TaxID=3775 RepID=A0A1Q3CGR3_CEPFO|nr:RWP-RK domain-containing protein [Cephalotus follicularis]
MSSQQYTLSTASVSASTQPLSFHQISKFFSLPLSDAASNLGVCVSTLKKICRENGLDRWPYRKFLSGRSIEEIKRYAARERCRELYQLSRARKQSGSQSQNNEMRKLQGVAPHHNLQQGNKTSQVGQPHISINASLTKGMTTLDEFKYGFPSNGLSTATNKWWGSSSPDGYESICEDGAEIEEDDKSQSDEKVNENANSMVLDKEKHENGDKENIGPHGIGILTAVRKRNVEDGREALMIGVHSYGIKKLARRESALLLRIFRSPFPKDWICGSS